MKAAATAGSGFIAYMSGLANEITVVLLFVMILDFLTGLMRAKLTKSVNSTIGLAGIIKKFSILVVLAMTGAIEFLFIELGQNTNGLIIVGVSSFFIVNECISILENSAQLGVPIPPIIYNSLEKLHGGPLGEKEQRVPRDPELDRLDKAELYAENKRLNADLKKHKRKRGAEELQAQAAETAAAVVPIEHAAEIIAKQEVTK